MEVQIILFAMVATISTTLVTLIWFSRLLFGDSWLRETSVNRYRYRPDTAIGIFATVIVQFMTAVIFKAFLVYGNLQTPSEIFGFAALLFVGFILPTCIYDLLWTGRSARYFAMNAGHHLLVLMIISILGSIIP